MNMKVTSLVSSRARSSIRGPDPALLPLRWMEGMKADWRCGQPEQHVQADTPRPGPPALGSSLPPSSPHRPPTTPQPPIHLWPAHMPLPASLRCLCLAAAPIPSTWPPTPRPPNPAAHQAPQAPLSWTWSAESTWYWGPSWVAAGLQRRGRPWTSCLAVGSAARPGADATCAPPPGSPRTPVRMSRTAPGSCSDCDSMQTSSWRWALRGYEGQAGQLGLGWQGPQWGPRVARPSLECPPCRLRWLCEGH